jgi:hypothetical protein
MKGQIHCIIKIILFIKERVYMKYKIVIEERTKFSHEMIIDVPDSMDIDDVLDKAQDNSEGLGDVGYELEKMGVTVIEICEDDSGEPDELEITECNEYDEEDC